MRENYFICHLFIEKNYPVLHICALQKYVNLCFQYLVWPPLAAVTEGKVSCKYWSVLHNNVGVLAHSLVKNHLNSVMLVGFLMNCLLRSFHKILIGLRSGLWLSHSKTLTLFFFNHSLVEWLVCLGLLSCCMTFSWDSVLKQMSWHFPLEFAGIIQNSLFHQWWQAVLAKMLHNRPKPWYYHHHVSQMGEDS